MTFWKWIGARLGLCPDPVVLANERGAVFDFVIDELCAVLDESARDVQTSTETISNQFMVLARMAGEQGQMIEAFGRTVGSLAHKGGNVSLENFIAMMERQITAPIDRMIQLSQNAINLSHSTERMFGQVGNIENVVRQVYVINNKTRMLTFNATIEAARAGSNGRGFAVVANEIKNISEEINDMATRVRQELAALSSTLRQGQDALMTMSGIDVTADQLMRGELEALMRSLSEQHDAIVRCLDKSAEMARHVSAQVGYLTINIQFQDRNSQFIQSVITMLRRLNRVHKSELSGAAFLNQILADIPLSNLKNKISAKAFSHGLAPPMDAQTANKLLHSAENIEMF